MSEISVEAEARLAPLLDEVVLAVTDGNESKLIKGEYFGYAVSRFVKGYMVAADKESPAFNSSIFSPPKLKRLRESVDKTLSFINKDDPLASAGELKFILRRLYDKVAITDDMSVEPFGFKVYLLGMFKQVENDMLRAVFPNTEQKARLMNFRRYCVTLGVVEQVLQSARA